MNIMKPVVISILLTLGIFCAVLYTSCSKDGCKGVYCMNNSSCSGGICQCTKQGIGGVNCEIIYRNLYAHIYKGVVNFAGKLDSATTIDSNIGNHLLTFSPANDTMSYLGMTIAWKDSTSKLLVSLPITLTTNTASGSDFTVPATPADTFTYSGYGNVSPVSATLNLVRTHPHGSSKVNISFNSFTRQ